MSQDVEFEVAPEPISVSSDDAGRLVEQLRRQTSSADCASAADKIERATDLGETGAVRLSTGEDECVYLALHVLRQTGEFLEPLVRLERALRESHRVSG
jgi:hypothetical protein